MTNTRFKNLTSILLLMVLCWVSTGYAQKGQGGTESNLHWGFGARAMGLGRAFTAMADDPTAVFWNPAGLEFVYQQSISFFHSTLPEGASYDFLGYAFPTLNLGTFGIGIGRIGISDVPYRDINGFSEGYPNFSWDEYQGFFSYAKKLPWDITSGLTVRLVRRGFSNIHNEGDLIDYGVGMDLGLMYRPEFFTNALLKDWSIGLNVRNLFAPQVKEGTQVDEMPLTLRLGIMRKLFFMGGGNNVNLLLDLDYSQNRDMLFNVGMEYRFRELGMLRAGLDGNAITFGAGMKYSVFQVDYAFGNSYYSEVLPAVHRVSLSINFGLNRDEMYEIAAAKRRAEEERIIADIRELDRRRFIADRLKKADEYFNQGEWLDAIVEYQQVITQDPFNSRAQMMIDSSNTLLQKQFAERQALAIEDALDKERAEMNRRFVNERFERGRALLDQKKYTEALIEFNRALERSPNDETIIGAINTTRRQIAQEISNLIQVSRREYQNGNYSEALRLLTDARLLGGDNPEIQREIELLTQRYQLAQKMQQGLSLYEIGEYDRALQIFEQAMKIDPADELVRQYYQRTKVETEGKSEEMPPDVERKYLEGIDRFVKGRYREAIEIWEEIRKEYPYNKKVIKAIEGARERLQKAQN